MAATTTRFGFDLRVLLCERCGAPIDAAPEGGSVTCRYCGAVLQVAARVALPEFASVDAASIAEPERLARLAAQAREPVVAPAGLAAVLANDEIPPWRAGEAFAVWQSVRRRAAEGDLVASEELSYLTNKLWTRLDAEPARQRALLETTLETLALPRHRQLVLGALVQGAVHVGDREAAERWLSRCDASLDDLRADSSYRMARALVATMRGDWAEVLAMIGPRPRDVPLAREWRALATLLRGNAHLRLGDPRSASTVLTDVGGDELARESARFPGLIAPELLVRADRAQRNTWVALVCTSSLLAIAGWGAVWAFSDAADDSVLAGAATTIGGGVGAVASLALPISLAGLVFGWGSRTKR